VLTALVFVSILLTAVVVHELAHYGAARSVGVPVRAFSVGFGPVLARKQWRGTEWRLSLIPLGGYVDLPGLSSEVSEDGSYAPAQGGMAEKSFAAKAWILSAGVLSNFLLGTVLLSIAVVLQPGFRALTTGEVPAVVGTTIVAVEDGSIASSLGIRAGDEVLEIGSFVDPVPADVVSIIQETTGELRLLLLRGEERVVVETLWPPQDLADAATPRLGVQLAPSLVPPVPWTTAFAESAVFAVRALPEMVSGFVQGFASALTGQQSEEIAGPVGIVTMVADATQVGLASVLVLAAIINFSLAVFNLLPIPGLDGGRIVLSGIVALRGKPFRPGQEEAFHVAGFLAVLAMIVLITLQEVQSILASS